MNKLTLPEMFRHRLQGMVQNGSRWFHQFDPELDRLEDFASDLGKGYIDRVDGASLALAGGLCCLLLLVIAI